MQDAKRAPIIFLLGPSGSGKTKLGSWLSEDLAVLHLEIDRWPDGDGIDREKLRLEWDVFWRTGQAVSLAAVIRKRVARARRQGAVLSFPSTLVLPAAVLRGAEQEGIRSFVLYGTSAECLTAFLERERAKKDGLSQDHWVENNVRSYLEYSREEFAPYRLGAFAAGKRRKRADLVAAS